MVSSHVESSLHILVLSQLPMASGKTGGVPASLGVGDGMNLMPPPQKYLSYVEKAAILDETIARESTSEKRLARESARNGAFHINPYNRGDPLHAVNIKMKCFNVLLLSKCIKINSVFQQIISSWLAKSSGATRRQAWRGQIKSSLRPLKGRKSLQPKNSSYLRRAAKRLGGSQKR